MTYAENTSVPVERSRAELERTLERYGADAFMYGWNEKGAAIQFRAHGKHVRFELPLPSAEDVVRQHRGARGGKVAAQKRWEQETRSRWRALVLVVKAKLEAVEAGIAVFEDEFLAYTVLPDGTTAGEWLRPQIDEAYESGLMPAGLTLALPAGDPT